MKDVGGAEVIVDELLIPSRRAAADSVRVGGHRVVERRQHPACLGDLRRFSYVEEVAVNDGEDAERDIIQLDSEATVSCRNRSSDRDTLAVKPHEEGRRIGQLCRRSRSAG
jgi:hypothetical protein